MNTKTFACSLLLLVSSATIIAQPDGNINMASEKRFYIKAYGGYGFFTPGSYKVESRTNFTYQVAGLYRDTSIISLGKNGLGGGLRFGGGIGYILNSFMNIGIDAEYLKGITLKNNTITGDTNFVSSTLNYNVVTITPQIVFKAISYSNFYIYNKLGILITLPFDMEYASYDSTARPERKWHEGAPGPERDNKLSITTIRNTEGKYKIPISLGLNVALGCQVVISRNLRGFVEAFANFSVLSPESYHEVQHYNVKSDFVETQTLNGRIINVKYNQSDTYTNDYIYKKEGGLSFEYTSHDDSPQPTDVVVGNTTTQTHRYNNTQKQTSAKIYRNMNAMGINIGLAYRF